MKNVIKVNNLKKYFGKVRAVDGVSFEVKAGEIMGFLGPNGAGKTTTISCMMDFLRPDAGSITILDQDAQQNSTQLKREIGFLPSDVDLYENWTGQEHIKFIEAARGLSSFDEELIDRLSFDPSKKASKLSSGNRQKLGLILALMHKPKVLIMDEPTNGLDPILQQTIYKTLESFADSGAAIFMSSHNLHEVERLCDRVAIIKRGKLMAVEEVNHDDQPILQSRLEKKFLEYYRS